MNLYWLLFLVFQNVVLIKADDNTEDDTEIEESELGGMEFDDIFYCRLAFCITIIVIAAFSQKRKSFFADKSLFCLEGTPSIPTPINFLESRGDRRIVSCLFGSCAGTLCSIYFWVDAPESVKGFEQYYYIGLLVLVGLLFYPLFLARTYIEKPQVLIPGCLYSIFTLFILCYSARDEDGFYPGVLSLLPSIFCMLIVVLFFIRAVYRYFTGKKNDIAHLEGDILSDYKTYVASLLTPKSKALKLLKEIERAKKKEKRQKNSTTAELLSPTSSSSFSTSSSTASTSHSASLSINSTPRRNTSSPSSADATEIVVVRSYNDYASKKSLDKSPSYLNPPTEKYLEELSSSTSSNNNDNNDNNDSNNNNGEASSTEAEKAKKKKTPRVTNKNTSISYNAKVFKHPIKFLSPKLNAIVSRFYQPIELFHYSPRVLSTFLVAAIMIFEMFIIFVYYYYLILDSTGKAYESEYSTDTMHLVIRLGRAALLISFLTGYVLCNCYILNIMAIYRKHLLQLRVGNYSFLPNNLSKHDGKLVDALHFSGYQIAYLMLGFTFFSSLLFLVFAALIAVLAIPTLRDMFWGWAYRTFIVPLFVSISFMIFQIVVVRLWFSVDKGNGVHNQRAWHNFDYSMFFINIIIGLFSYIGRILKSFVFMALFFCRLDKCVTIKGYERFDVGYAAYVGLLLLDHFYSNPVLISAAACFIRSTIKDPSNSVGSTGSLAVAIPSTEATYRTQLLSPFSISSKFASENKPHKSNPRARTRWFLMYTLVNNPSLILLRVHNLETAPSPRFQTHFDSKRESLA